MREFQLNGQILAVRPETSELLIKHEDIKGFMPGMTMAFKVKDASLLQGRTAGDLVTARLMVGDTEAWLAAVAKTGSAPLTEPPPPASPYAGITLLEVGSEIPEVALIDDRGQPLALATLRGSAVAITFIYTRCPLPQYCPLMDRRFAEVQQLLAQEASLRGRARLLSVSFDPDADTPEVLRAHAQKLNADAAVWQFATAPREVVDRFAAHFRVNVIREADRTITHNLRTAVVGPDGRVVALYDNSNWTAPQIVDDMRRSLTR